MESIFIKCVDCQEEFEHTVRDQEFYAERKFTPPKRCRNCRMKKKARMGDNRPRPPTTDGFYEFGRREY